LARQPIFPICLSTVFGLGCVLGTFAVANLGALIIGLIETWRARRNMLPAAIRMACYLAAYLVCWELLGAGLGLLVSGLDEWGYLEVLQGMTGIFYHFLAMAMFTIPNIIAAAIYLYLIARGTKAARYANK
jgi:hypothetical protein